MNRWRVSIAYTSQAFQQIGGTNLVTYYATFVPPPPLPHTLTPHRTVFEDSLGFSPALARLLTACYGTLYLAAGILALFVVDRFGRRKMMIFGAGGMGISALIIGACISHVTPTYTALAYAATVFIFIFIACFALGWLGVTWLYPAEVTPIRIRAEANGLSTSANWLFNYAVVQLAPIMIYSISWKTYFVFMCFNFAFIPVIYFTFVETNGYPLEKLDAIFEEAYSKKENPVWTEKRIRKGQLLEIEKKDEAGILQNEIFQDEKRGEKRSPMESGATSDVDVERWRDGTGNVGMIGARTLERPAVASTSAGVDGGEQR